MKSIRSWMLAAALGAFVAPMSAAFDARDASAVGTRTFDLDTADKLGGGEQQGTAVTSTGLVVAGWSTARTALSGGVSVRSALLRPDGSILVGVAPEGRVIKVDAQGKESIVADLEGAFAATSIVQGPGDKIYVATYPKGEIFVVDPNAAVGVNPSAPKPPKPKAWVKLPSDHVWGLAYDGKKKELFAATGPDGKIYRIDAAGKFQVHHAVDDEQVVSIAIGGDGTLYAGTSPKGLLYAIKTPLDARVIEDFHGNDVKSIVVVPGKNGKGAATETLYCIANEYSGGGESPKPKVPGTKQPVSAYEPPKATKGKGELWKFEDPAGVAKGERLHHDDTTPFFSLAAPLDAKPGGYVAYVGTSNEGKVVAVDDVHGWATLAKVDERQVGAIALAASAGKGSWFVTGDAAVAHRVTGIGAPDATWTSRALDAGLKATFGKLSWRSDGPLELETRTGATEKPDDTWSKWSAPITQPGKTTAPAGRYVQVRARWKGQPATLRAVSIAFVTENLRAIVTDVTVPTKGELPKAGAIPASGSEVPKHDATIKLTWKVDDPDNDALRYRLWYKREGTAIWRPITKDDEPISSSDYSWNTEALAEGWYRVRVEASDEMANPIGGALKHALDSAAFSVDNTPPTIEGLRVTKGVLEGTAKDGVGPIARLEVEIDGKPPWRPIAPKDGILDDATEAIAAPLDLPAGNHVVALRAYDAAGNSVTQEVEAK